MTIILLYIHIWILYTPTVYTYLDLIYIAESFAREGRHPSWNTTLLGPVLTHIVTSLACKPKMDQ